VHTDCTDIGTSAFDNPAFLQEVLDSSDPKEGESSPVPVTSLEITSVPSGALVDGSGEQTNFFNVLKVDMGLALEIPITEIEVSRSPDSPNSELSSGRRRAEETSITCDFVITSDNPIVKLENLVSQLADPSSVLMNGEATKNVSPESLSFGFTCAAGMYRTAGMQNCKLCVGGELNTDRTACLPPSTCSGENILNPATDNTTCTNCGMREAPDPSTGECVCASGFYLVTGFGTAAQSAIRCYQAGQAYDKTDLEVDDRCMPCYGMLCIDCTVDGVTGMQPGYSLSETKIELKTDFINIVGGRDVYQCSHSISEGESSCTGNSKEPCHASTTGPLCSLCHDDYSRSGLAGDCTACEESAISTILAGLGVILAYVATLGALYFISGINTNNSKSAVLVVFLKVCITWGP
jgi:hypothetical protein